MFFHTKLRNVAGLSTTVVQKSGDMFLKCRYLDEITDGKGVIFASGTPVSNSLSELYTVQRYLQYDTLQRMGLGQFDSWSSTFAETQTSIELSPQGSGYRSRTRFAKFQNLPELMNLFCEVADIKTADTLDLPRPKANFHTIVVKPTEIQKDLVANLSVRAKAVQEKLVDKKKDNTLVITTDGRKIGLDQRIINDMFPDDPGSKVNACMNNVYRIWEETKDKRLTQAIFCDFSTPNKDGRFNVYHDLQKKFIAKGIPKEEIALIHDYDTEVKKKDLFAKIRSGKVRILLGSTSKCGAGSNFQDRLIALHDLDFPWRPADLTQRSGRIIRQGNTNPEVDIYRYCTESTFDAYLLQTLEKKQNFISQIMTSKSPVRACEDVDEQALSYAEIKALCAGDPTIKEKMDLDIEVSRLLLLKSDYQNQYYKLQDSINKFFPAMINSTMQNIEETKNDLEKLKSHPSPGEGIAPMLINDKAYTNRNEAGEAVIELCKKINHENTDIKLGNYRGFDLSVSYNPDSKKFTCLIKGSMTYSTELFNDPSGNITRINNAIEKVPEQLNQLEEKLQTLQSQLENAKTELAKPFVYEADLAKKSARLTELDTLLNMDKEPETEANPVLEEPKLGMKL